MAEKFVAACIQNNASPDVSENISACLELAHEAAKEGAEFISLPEYFSGLRTENALIIPTAFPEESHPAILAFQNAAKSLNAWFLLGSLGITNPDGRVSNRAYMINPQGDITARYNKIHMFDVELEPGKFYTESATIRPGEECVVANTPWGGLGLSICYDLRFAALYRQLAKGGASILAVPAAFTKVTGEAHWHVLNRARAIEHGCFVIAPCQHGKISGGGEAYGHSLIIDPWGKVLADGGEGEGIAVAEVDMALVSQARRKIPALTHDRKFSNGDERLAAE
ncbi:MAG: carbon-nitrogen hydrolase family protein [Rhizobiaceae bacterium]